MMNHVTTIILSIESKASTIKSIPIEDDVKRVRLVDQNV